MLIILTVHDAWCRCRSQIHAGTNVWSKRHPVARNAAAYQDAWHKLDGLPPCHTMSSYVCCPDSSSRSCQFVLCFWSSAGQLLVLQAKYLRWSQEGRLASPQHKTWPCEFTELLLLLLLLRLNTTKTADADRCSMQTGEKRHVSHYPKQCPVATIRRPAWYASIAFGQSTLQLKHKQSSK